jgi:hypothetical protein
MTQAMSESSEGDPIDAVIMFRDQGKASMGTAKSKPELAVQKLGEQEEIEYDFFPHGERVARPQATAPAVRSASISSVE